MTVTSMQGSDNDERESSRATSLVLNSTRDNSENNQRREPLSSIDALMLEDAGDKIGGTTETRNAILNMAQAAKQLQSIIGIDGEVHVFISPLSNNSTTSELFTIVSKLFHNALRSGTVGANLTSHALRDLFQIARISVANKLPGGIETRATPCVSFSLPDWFPWNARQNLGTISNERPP